MKFALTVLVLGAVCILTPCRASIAATPGADQEFEALAQHYLEALLEMQPEYATQLGDHRYDDRLNDYSLLGVARARRFNQRILNELDRIPQHRLSRVNNVDYRILRTHLQAQLFKLNTLREYEWNPLNYGLGDAIYPLLSRNYAPLPQRLRSLQGRLEAIPGVLAAARMNLNDPPRIFTETAILQNDGVISLIRDDLPGFVAQAPEQQAQLAPARQRAIEALEAYGQWLKDDLLPRSNGDFRLGDRKFREKLRFTLESDLSKEEILRRAEAELKLTQEKIYDVAVPLFKQYFPTQTDRLQDKPFVVRSVLKRLAQNHPTADSIVRQANDCLSQATDFVREHALVTLPDEPVKAIVMPEFERGVSVASCEAPGPLEKNSQTYYNIAPPPAQWNAERVASYFRENNDYMLQDLTVHEAMPGHYVQLWHAKTFSAPTRLRAIFESGLFVEGWAVYAEQMMAEEGYGGPEVHMEQLKMRLRVIINAILDQKIHTEGMTEAQAIELMMHEGYQEEGEAVGKWRRACLTSTQLSTYFVGSSEVRDIRRAYEAKFGKTPLKKLHDFMLSFGSVAPKYVRELMGL